MYLLFKFNQIFSIYINWRGKSSVGKENETSHFVVMLLINFNVLESFDKNLKRFIFNALFLIRKT